MIVSRSIHISINDPVLFLLIAEEYSTKYMYHIFFLLSSVDEHLSCFHAPAVVNNAAMTPEVHVSFFFFFSCVFLNYVFLCIWPVSPTVTLTVQLLSGFTQPSLPSDMCYKCDLRREDPHPKL